MAIFVLRYEPRKRFYYVESIKFEAYVDELTSEHISIVERTISALGLVADFVELKYNEPPFEYPYDFGLYDVYGGVAAVYVSRTCYFLLNVALIHVNRYVLYWLKPDLAIFF